MVEKRIVEQCAPTLAGIKIGCLFRMSCAIDDIASEIDSMNSILNPRGVRIATFIPSGCGTLVYVYREGLLSRMDDERSVSMLKELGYDTSSDEGLLRILKERIEKKGCVPHEIGLFLGYPFEDVAGFMANKERPKCMGCWKVYGSVDLAQRLFRSFRECRSRYSALYSSGIGISDLTVTC